MTTSDKFKQIITWCDEAIERSKQSDFFGSEPFVILVLPWNTGRSSMRARLGRTCGPYGEILNQQEGQTVARFPAIKVKQAILKEIN